MSTFNIHIDSIYITTIHIFHIIIHIFILSTYSVHYIIHILSIYSILSSILYIYDPVYTIHILLNIHIHYYPYVIIHYYPLLNILPTILSSIYYPSWISRSPQVSNLLGELSAVIRDGDAFGDFVQLEGCGSPLAKQTLQQATIRNAWENMGEKGGVFCETTMDLVGNWKICWRKHLEQWRTIWKIHETTRVLPPMMSPKMWDMHHTWDKRSARMNGAMIGAFFRFWCKNTNYGKIMLIIVQSCCFLSFFAMSSLL